MDKVQRALTMIDRFPFDNQAKGYEPRSIFILTGCSALLWDCSSLESSLSILLEHPIATTQRDLSSLPASNRVTEEELNRAKHAIFSSKTKAEAKMLVDAARVCIGPRILTNQ